MNDAYDVIKARDYIQGMYPRARLIPLTNHKRPFVPVWQLASFTDADFHQATRLGYMPASLKAIVLDFDGHANAGGEPWERADIAKLLADIGGRWIVIPSATEGNWHAHCKIDSSIGRVFPDGSTNLSFSPREDSKQVVEVFGLPNKQVAFATRGAIAKFAAGFKSLAVSSFRNIYSNLCKNLFKLGAKEVTPAEQDLNNIIDRAIKEISPVIKKDLEGEDFTFDEVDTAHKVLMDLGSRAALTLLSTEANSEDEFAVREALRRLRTLREPLSNVRDKRLLPPTGAPFINQGVVQPERPEWLIKNWLPKGEVTLLGAQGGAGKTHVALRIAGGLAAGINRALPTHREAVQGAPVMRLEPNGVEQPYVLYVTYEDKPEMLQYRLTSYNDLHDKEVRLYYHNLKGYGPLWAPESTRHRDTRLQLTHAGRCLEDHIKEHKPVLVVLDSVVAAFGGNQLDAGAVRTFLGYFSYLAETEGTSFLLLAHLPKSGSGGGQFAAAGSTDWQNGCRSVWLLEREQLTAKQKKEKGLAEDDPGKKKLSLIKANHAKPNQWYEVAWNDPGFAIKDGNARVYGRPSMNESELRGANAPF